MLILDKGQPSTFIEAFALRSLRGAERVVDRTAPALAVVLILVFSSWAWMSSARHVLEYDELLEIAAATAPTSGEVASYLAAGVDYNPPLSHLLVRASIGIFGPADWAPRLPGFVGVCVLLWCLYALLSRWLSRSYGVMGILIVMCTPLRIYAREARPYGLVLGLVALGLVLYLRASNPDGGTRTKLLALLGYAGVNACLPAVHYYAVLAVSGFLFAEGAKILKSRKANWAVFVCTVVPPVITIALLRNVIRGQRQQLAHYFAKGNLLSFNHGYDSVQIDPFIYGIAILLIFGIAAVLLMRREAIGPISFPLVSANELLLALGLMLIPLEGAFLTQFVTHAYLPRYFLPAAIGFNICFCCAVKFLADMVPGAAIGVLIALGLGFGNIMVQDLGHPASGSLPGSDLSTSLSPIVFDAPGDYLQALHYAPALRGKLLVIADPASSIKARAYDTDDKIMLALASKGRADTTTLTEVARKWPRFGLIPRPSEYASVLKCVVDAGGEARLVAPYGAGTFLFDVSVPQSGLDAIDRCSGGTP